jgi:rare lipoprotein A
MGLIEVLTTVLMLSSFKTWSGEASYYSRSECVGCDPNMIMANGQPLDDSKLTVAFNKAELGSAAMVVNKANNKSVIARVTDTGGFEKLGRIIDLSLATKEATGCSDLCQVEVILLSNE